jgi:hypothetical protein
LAEATAQAAAPAPTAGVDQGRDGSETETEHDTPTATETHDADAQTTPREKDNDGEIAVVDETTIVTTGTMADPPMTPRRLGFNTKDLVLEPFDPENGGRAEVWVPSSKLRVRAQEHSIGAPWPALPLYLHVASYLRGSAATWFQDFDSRTARRRRPPPTSLMASSVDTRCP